MPPAIKPMDSQIRKRKGKKEHSTFHILDGADKRAVSIHLSDVDRLEKYPDRIITLEHPNWSAEISRGSSTDTAAFPRPGNALFSSKVMSRHHAELNANPETRILTLKDNGSMHGTLLNGQRVPRSGLELLSDDIITFGNQVVAKDNTYPALKTAISYQWTEDDLVETNSRKPAITNTFTAEYSDADIDVYSEYDDEIEVIRESVRQPSVEILEQPVLRLNSSSTNTSPRTDSDRRASSSVTGPTDSSSNLDEAEDKQKDGEVTPAKTTLFPGSKVNRDFNPLATANTITLNHDSSDNESSQDYASSEDYEEEFDDDDEYDQEEDDDDEVLDNHPPASDSPVTIPVTLGYPRPSSNKLEREPSPSDAAMARPVLPTPAQVGITIPSRYPAPQAGSTSDDIFASMCKAGHCNTSKDTLTPLPVPQYQFGAAMPPAYVPYQYQPLNSPLSNSDPYGYNITSHTSTGYSWDHAGLSDMSYLTDSQAPSFSSPTRHYVPTWAKSARETPSLVLQNATLKRKADDMSSYDDSNWAPEEQGEQPEQEELSVPQSTEIPVGSPVWHPESPEDPSMQVRVTVEATEPSDVATRFFQSAEEYVKESETTRAEVEDQAAAQNEAILADTRGMLEVGHREQIAQDSTPVESSIESAISTQPSVAPIEPSTTATETEAVQEPPRKKVKVSQSRLTKAGSTAKSAMKYAAVALAGGAAGAMGTVYALASLPPDYFVSAT